jgi:hypothetical protein
MYLIEKNGLARPICRECRKLHAAKNCPKLDRRIILAIAESERLDYRVIAGDLGIPWRRVQQVVGRLLREDRARRRVG